MKSDNLILGMSEGAAVPLTLARAGAIAAHTCIIGQSGSGKSFFLARLIEEIALRTHCQIIILDPNGDYRRIGEVASGVWSDPVLSLELSKIASLADDMHLAHREKKEDFKAVWGVPPDLHTWVLFGRMPAAPAPTSWPSTHLPLHVRWGGLYSDQETVHGIDHRTHSGLFRAYIAVNKLVSPTGDPITLGDLKKMALSVAEGSVPQRSIPHDGVGLENDDWRVLALHIERLEKRFSMLAPPPKEGLPDLPGILKRRRASDNQGLVSKAIRICEIDLSDTARDDRLLCLCTVIKTVMYEARREWSRANNPGAIDSRVPTLIVIDEAQHFAPEIVRDELAALASQRVADVVAEGRKYGVFVVLATQRPGKIRQGLLNEIDNLALLTLASPVERDSVVAAFGLPREMIDRVSDIAPGHGLLHGKWSAIPTFSDFAPARTVVGGTNLDPARWAPGL